MGNNGIKQSASGVVAYLNKIGFKTIEASYYTTIQNWLDWYASGVDEFHKQKFWNGKKVIETDLKSLGMAKTVSETWANLLMNEKVQIKLENEGQDKAIQEVLSFNDFDRNANRLCEMYMALGTGAFVEQLQEKEIMIDFVNASMIFPLSWNSRGIQECAFASQMHDAKIGDYLYIQIHSLNEQGNYVMTNRMVQIVDAELNFKELELPENVADEVDTQTDVPMFQIIMPNIINNVDIYNPMGVSVYANAIDVLKEVDTSFDALDVEIRTGRRIILLGVEGFYNDENGNLHNVVTDNDDVLRYIGDSSKNELIHDFSPDFRISALKESLQFQLNLLSEKTGMGTNQFEFTSKGVKTATEVISEDSDMYSTLKKHEKVLDSAIRGLIQAIGTLLGYDIDAQDIQIDFDDSIIEDKDAERKNDQIDLANGTLRLEEYRAKWRNETEEVAKKNLPEASGVLE